MLNRLFKRKTVEKNLFVIKGIMNFKSFIDIHEHWAFYDIIDAANSRYQKEDNNDWDTIIR